MDHDGAISNDGFGNNYFFHRRRMGTRVDLRAKRKQLVLVANHRGPIDCRQSRDRIHRAPHRRLPQSFASLLHVLGHQVGQPVNGGTIE